MPRTSQLEPADLVRWFYDDLQEFGILSEVAADELPPAMRQLLVHDDHMTVSMEAFHQSPVDVQVLGTRRDDSHYVRMSLLTRAVDGVVVQLGFVRILRRKMAPSVWQEITSERVPLGRILISHNVLRKVSWERLFRFQPGPALQSDLRLPNHGMYGRTARIQVRGEPLIDLLEIALVDQGVSGPVPEGF